MVITSFKISQVTSTCARGLLGQLAKICLGYSPLYLANHDNCIHSSADLQRVVLELYMHQCVSLVLYMVLIAFLAK